MIQNVSASAAANAAALSKVAASASQQEPVKAAAAPQTTVTKKAVPSVAELNAEAFLQRQQIGAALYDRSFTLKEGASVLKRQDAIAAYAEQIQAKEGGPTDKELRRLARKLERAETQIQTLSNNNRGANLSSLEGIDGKELDTVQDNLAARIQHGLKDGSLTEAEGKILLARQQEINDVEVKLRASDGKLTAGEQKQLLDQLRKTADEINQARNNGDGTNLGTYSYADSVNARQAALEKQLDQGIKLGSLTAGEADQVRVEFDKVNALEEKAMANGTINWRESVGLSSAMNGAEIKLYDLQRNKDGVKLADSYVDVKYVDQRQAQQLESITRGIDKGLVTNDEGIVLLKDQQSIQNLEDRLVSGGLTRGEYLRLQTELNDFSLVNADLQGNKDRWTGIFPTSGTIAPPPAPVPTPVPNPATPASADPSILAGTPVEPPAAPAPGTVNASASEVAGSAAPATAPSNAGSLTTAARSAADDKVAAESAIGQLRAKVEDVKDRLGELMLGMMQERNSTARNLHEEMTERSEQLREDMERRAPDEHKTQKSGDIWANDRSDLNARDADRENKIRSYTSIADNADRFTPVLAKKVA